MIQPTQETENESNFYDDRVAYRLQFQMDYQTHLTNPLSTGFQEKSSKPKEESMFLRQPKTNLIHLSKAPDAEM
jgi:hypothetical protein